MAGIACSACGTTAHYRCKACAGAFYCGKQCQSSAWPAHRAHCADVPALALTLTSAVHTAHTSKNITAGSGGDTLQHVDRIDLSVFTWNMSGDDARRTVAEWDVSNAGRAWLEALRPEKMRVVVLMLQEVDGKGRFGDFITGKFKDRGYRTLRVKNTSISRLFNQFFDQHQYIFIPPAMAQNFHASDKLSTCFGDAKSCVKGTVAQFVQLRFAGERYANLLFMCSHLPFKGAGEKGARARVAAYRATADAILTPAFARIAIKGVTRENTAVVWGGDMNFRNALQDPSSKAEANWRDGGETWERALRPYVRDELTRARFHPDVPVFPPGAWREFGQPADLERRYVPAWPPTCKVRQEKHKVSELADARTKGLPRAYDPDRLPSHCDRVFYAAGEGAPRVVDERVSKEVPASLDSDHDALRVDFALTFA